jgi:hypothetical protein
MSHRKSVSPFNLATSLGLAGFHTGITLWHRLPMLAAASSHGPELNRMVSEKTAAVMQGTFAAQLEFFELSTKAMTGSLGVQDIAHMSAAIAGAGLRPAFRTVKANSRRLSRR